MMASIEGVQYIKTTRAITKVSCGTCGRVFFEGDAEEYDRSIRKDFLERGDWCDTDVTRELPKTFDGYTAKQIDLCNGIRCTGNFKLKRDVEIEAELPPVFGLQGEVL
jgi:hypothetical protein